ncbi:DUF4336 domain-containing protein [Leptospira sp. severe_002]|uniref:DUF4336 domain-containing protein n=1 Tax=Leptospira sp. severe_002 TaxID=2838237 RepID=UPI001E3EEF5F|nr:DUF4336 domain-containing protein [Leptospira sp. severe_002]
MQDSAVAVLEQFGSDIWIAAGPTVASLGFRYPTRMAVIRLSDGELFLWSPVAVSPELRAQIDSLGKVRVLVTPNSLHHLFLQEWRAAYPDAVLYAAPGSRERCKDIAFDKDLGDEPAQAWAGQIEQVPMRGNLLTTEVVFFHRKSGVVLFADLIQHFQPGWFTGWRALAARLDGMVAAHPQVPKKFRMAFVDRKAAREGLERILAWPAEKVLMAHAEPVRENGRAFIERAFQWLR